MIHKCYDCIFVYLAEYLFLKLFNKCEQDVIVGVELSQHSKNFVMLQFSVNHLMSHTVCHYYISVNETVKTESYSIVKYIELCKISASTELQSYQFLWRVFLTKLRLLETNFLFFLHPPPTPPPIPQNHLFCFLRFILILFLLLKLKCLCVMISVFGWLSLC